MQSDYLSSSTNSRDRDGHQKQAYRMGYTFFENFNNKLHMSSVFHTSCIPTLNIFPVPFKLMISTINAECLCSILTIEDKASTIHPVDLLQPSIIILVANWATTRYPTIARNKCPAKEELSQLCCNIGDRCHYSVKTSNDS